MRVMGLDIGKKTIGVALSDPVGLTAQPVTTVKRTTFVKDIEAVLKLASGNEVSTIVAGLPLNMDGTHSPQTGFVLKFVDRLRESASMPVETWDERLSTAAVERVLIEGDISRSRRKEVVDKLAASYILQGYLDSRRVE
ncbi:MAG TPA: Holliday junction resolvase RuvX [Deltaproteobacteria bacterium]|nr:MAG: Holliday junction DNA helicase RuvA [Deltaproteobacteria bacterium GWA2_55_82]OGQ62091.1 MAG: Holliday junction DNA helicase RuvA [Deltaproteobacteria bacterium RIFCSPLOWO2_02_FULL_55_12]OIJ74048.1 MAG: Holliday junction DNA helicase RuvA [Deltaproteobacteria bacterium GWC2_55_46]HBG46659.1 Holliday junction resolvase RuvX [Deltaproteobacteria bacterium]HCY11333.1 Holliday junction resolvase RuvX [Deltaproteobacteria bacterium]